MANKKTNENQEIQEEQNPVDESKNSENYGVISQILGSVIDVRFEEGHTPKILNALKIIDEDKKFSRVNT